MLALGLVVDNLAARENTLIPLMWVQSALPGLVCAWLLLAPQFLSCWPSWVDWKIALRSWPYPVFGAAAWWLAGSLHP